MIGLIGRKVGMTRLFGRNGESIPVTAILAGPCYVVQIKTEEKEGYRAVQLGGLERRKKLVKKPQLGHFAKAGVDPKAKLVEFRVKNTDLYRQGQELKVDIFQEGDRVTVTGTSKGKGFTGGVKRWGFAGGPKTHGQSDRHRAPGSIGGASWPSRVWKGMKMAGRMGTERVTVRNLEVVKVDLEQNILLVKGPVPGARNGHLLVQRTTELTAVPAPSGEAEQEAKPERSVEEKLREAPVSQVVEPEAPGVSETEVSEEVSPAQKEDVPEKKKAFSGEIEKEAQPERSEAEKVQKAPVPQEAELEAPGVSEKGLPQKTSLVRKEEVSQKDEATPEREPTGEEKEQANGQG